MKNPALCSLILLLSATAASGYESWIIPMGDESYTAAEELYLSNGRVPPFQEMPMAAESLKSRLDIISREGSLETAREASSIRASLGLSRPAFSFFLDAGPFMGTLNDPWLNSQIATKRYVRPVTVGETGTWVAGGTTFTDYNGIGEVLSLPPFLSMGILAHSQHFSILFNPELRASAFELLTNYGYANFPKSLWRFDLNFPYRGIATFWNGEFEARIGRDKLNLGPGRWSTLTVDRNMPFFDYGMASFHVPGFSFSGYLIRLNSVLSYDENDYINAIIDGTETNLEQNSYYYDPLSNIHSKTLTVGRFLFEPYPWLTIAVQQTNLIGGKYPQLTDLNPLIVFHNLYEEGFYGVPVSLSFAVVPLPGLYLYGEFVLYDVAFGDEPENPLSPSANAWQGGLTALSKPWIDLGPGRLRLDCEWSYASPWIYNKFISARRFTSRFVFVEPFFGRFWVDFPLGFYRGPDCWELDTRLSYGTPGQREVFFLWQRTAKGEVDMYGYGEGSDYAHTRDFPVNGLITGIPEVRDRLSLEGSLHPMASLRLGLRIRLTGVQNALHVTGDNAWFFDIGATARWSIY